MSNQQRIEQRIERQIGQQIGHQIEQRHRPDRWRDMIFVAGAVLLVALSIGSVTSKVAGPAPERTWTVTVIEGDLEVAPNGDEVARPR